MQMCYEILSFDKMSMRREIANINIIIARIALLFDYLTSGRAA